MSEVEAQFTPLGEFRVTRAGTSIGIELAEGARNPRFKVQMPADPTDIRLTIQGFSPNHAPLLVNYDLYRLTPHVRPNGTVTFQCLDVEGKPFDLRTGRLMLLSLRPTTLKIDVAWEGGEGGLWVATLPDEA